MQAKKEAAEMVFIWVSRDVRQRLKVWAAEQDISMGKAVERLIHNAIEKEKTQEEPAHA